jgi:hypothetical protein
MAAAQARREYEPAGTVAASEWADIAADAPEMAATMGRYLSQIATFLAPASVVVADNALRQLAGWALANTGIESVAEIRRDDIEDFKVWLSDRPGMKGSCQPTPTASGCGPCGRSSSGSSNGTGPTPPFATRSWAARSPKNPNRSRVSSTIATPRSSWQPRRKPG